MSKQQWENMTPERQKLWERLAELNTKMEKEWRELCIEDQLKFQVERDQIAKQLGLPE